MKTKKFETREEQIQHYRRLTAIRAKKKRLECAEMRRNGRLHERRLEFLRILLKRMGLTQKAFALAIGWTPQAIEYHFIEDDIRYGSLRKGFARLGFCLEAYFENKGPIQIGKTPACRIEIINPSGPIGRVRPDYPAYLTDCIVRDSQVAFVAEAIVMSGRSLGALCREAQIDCSSFREYIKKDDIRVSYLYKLAQPLYSTLVWRITPAEQ